MEAGLSLGSNMGDRLACLREAQRRIVALPGVADRGRSPIYETEPVGVAPEYQHLKYLNAVILIDSQAPAQALLAQIHGIEEAMGRIRGSAPNLPRPIDIDILYVGPTIIKDADLCIPHPRWAERSFVAKPLSDLRPNLIIPGASQPVRTIAANLPDAHTIRLFSLKW
ncbi:MAG: 2-amino-4-hydroxy-6-hydroxymethyldihydropteridine diphosphokinase [Kiritimatiellae bacterium]|nr:2-amino-4-hydroxy-6-hydroxymethyldihydropteridine diphosphokinase [Kiritimatiellia bacterium]MDD4735390.1 2-amino-4-hydroxy-6-hydroxymethyldihydropteridine diphosphokinase [Kiritimatiellia bacterium]